MNFKMTKIAALAAMAFASTGAHAVLTASNTLSIGGDATTVTTSFGGYGVGTDGPLADSYFTMGGNPNKLAMDTQFAYIYNGADLSLTGATQANINTWTYYGAPGLNKTTGTGISILSASGDTAVVDMSGWKVDWNLAVASPTLDVDMGSGAFGVGFVSGQGKVTCDVGSGCGVGSNYTLKYTATVPANSPAFANVKYYLELHGTVGQVAAIPEASTYGMMLAGLGLVGFAVRRRKQVI